MAYGHDHTQHDTFNLQWTCGHEVVVEQL